MKLIRHFFISDSLDDLERFERALEGTDIHAPQMHLLTLDDNGAASHPKLQQITSFARRDIVHSTLIGAAFGLGGAALVLIISHFAGWTATPAGWMPFVFLAVVVLGFLTWQGGLRGIQTPNAHFAAFEQALQDGRHVFFVDVESQYERLLAERVRHYPGVTPAGVARGAPHWLVSSQYHLKRFFTETFP